MEDCFSTFKHERDLKKCLNTENNQILICQFFTVQKIFNSNHYYNLIVKLNKKKLLCQAQMAKITKFNI